MYLRAPSPDIHQWDVNACETACTAQLLYMYGMLEVGDIAWIDGYIGRQPGEADSIGGNLRLILEKGFLVHETGPFDAQQALGPHGFEYIADVWRIDGRTEEEIYRVLPGMYPILRQSLMGILTLVDESQGRYTLTPKSPTFEDFLTDLSKGPVSSSIPSRAGYGHRILVTRVVTSNEYEIYDPLRGVLIGDGRILEGRVPYGFTAYSLP
jgi:hypothetical protein